METPYLFRKPTLLHRLDLCTASVKKILLLQSILLILSGPNFGQDIMKQMFFGINYSFHGSGDMDGMMVNVDMNTYYGKRISIVYNLGFSMHAGRAFPHQNLNDPSLPSWLQTAVPRWVTAGVQLSSLFTFNTSRHKYSGFKIGVGPLFRYQLNGSPNSYSYHLLQNISPQPFYVIKETDDNHFNLGYVVRLTYDFKSRRRSVFGINVFLQNDTNADGIVGFGVKYGFQFR